MPFLPCYPPTSQIHPVQGRGVSWGFWECQELIALCPDYLSAGLSSVKREGTMPKSNATRQNMPKELEVQSSAVGGTLEVIPLDPCFYREENGGPEGQARSLHAELATLQTSPWCQKPYASAQMLPWKKD